MGSTCLQISRYQRGPRARVFNRLFLPVQSDFSFPFLLHKTTRVQRELKKSCWGTLNLSIAHRSCITLGVTFGWRNRTIFAGKLSLLPSPLPWQHTLWIFLLTPSNPLCLTIKKVLHTDSQVSGSTVLGLVPRISEAWIPIFCSLFVSDEFYSFFSSVLALRAWC